LRLLDDLRLEHGRLDVPLPIGEEGGTLQVELNHTDPAVLPAGFRTDTNDSRILACALNLRAEGKDVTLVSKDTPLRVKAGAVGLDADEYHAQDVVVSGWSGMAELTVEQPVIDTLFADGIVDLDAARELPCHTGVRLLGHGSASALGRVNEAKQVQLVRGDREAFGLHGRSAEQRVALDLLLDDSVGIVSLGGKAGTGKSALALCAGLEAVLERRTQRKVVVFRPLYAVGGQQLGYLPGGEAEKMGPWAQAVFDTLEGLASQEVIEEVLSRGMLEVLPLTHIRGRSLHDSFVIVDEAQSLERNVLLTVLSRLGTGSRVVLTHDVAQRDNLRVGRHDGVAAVIEKLKGHPLFAHVTLTRSERSPIAALVTEMLEEFAPGATY
ncbi:PhoH family protein, partial [Gordonia otitidis]